jgi:hypothetical protein
MSEQKPVAEITIYGDIAGIATKENFNNYPSGTLLFTESQLKAEREKAVKLCIGIMWDTLEGENGLEIESKMLKLLSSNESKEG